jgi:Arc/MetJ family transcription regulator
MRMTITLDDDLVAKAQTLAGVQETSALLRVALTTYVERESARRLARLGASEPDIRLARRRRAQPA